MKTRSSFVKLPLSLAAVLLLVLSVASLSGTASAEPNDRRGNQVYIETTDESEAANEQATSEATAEDQVSEDSPKVRKGAEAARAAARAEIEKARSERKEAKTAEKRKLLCENRKKAIDNKLAAFAQAADKHLTKLRDVDAKVQSYQLNNNVMAPDFVAFQAASEEKKAAAELAVATLRSVAISVDCDNPETVVSLRTVKDASQTTRQALHEYKAAIKAMVSSLRNAQHDKENTAASPGQVEDSAVDRTNQVTEEN